MVDYNFIVKMGSSNTIIVKSGDGILLDEPSVVAVDAKGKVLSAGADAFEFAARDNMSMVYPVADGVIKNKQLAIAMLRLFLQKIEFKSLFAKNNVVMLIPSSISAQEKNDYVNVAYSCMFTSVTLLPTIFAGMVNMEIEEYDSRFHMLCSLGGGVCDVAVVSSGNIVNAVTVDLGGTTLDYAIKQYILDSYGVKLTNFDTQKLSKELATLLPNDIKTYNLCTLVDGSDVHLTSTELRPIYVDYFSRVANVISSLISSLDPQVVASVMKRGLYLFGGLSCITGVDKYLSNALNMPVYVDIEPENTVTNGSISMLNNPKLLNSLVEKFTK